jgi:hypothetical protein
MANVIQDPMDRLSTIIEGEKSPFVELSERMKETSKDIKNLNVSILDLAIALKERAGVTKDKKDKTKAEKDTDNDSVRPLFKDTKADLKDLTKGFIHGFTGAFVDFKDKISAKSEMPADVEKSNQNINVEKENNVELIRNNVTDENNKLQDINSEQNKVLSNMVEALTNMRDDTTQRKLLDEAASIKKIISDQNKKTELPGGIEPNTEESKQEDREKLAEAIARKLSEAMAGMGIGSNSGIPLIPPVMPPAAPTAAAAASPILAAATLGTVGVGGAIATYGATGMLAAQEEHRKAYSQEQDKSGMLSALSGDTGIASQILDANGDKTSEQIQKEQKQEQDKLKDAPWYTRLYGVGKEDYLKTLSNKESQNKIKDRKVEAPVGETDAQARLRIDRENEDREEARIEAKGSGTYVGNEKLVSGQPLSDKQMRANELSRSMGNSYPPEIEAQYNKQNQSVTVEPKKEENNVGNILNKVSDQNTELKMSNMGQSEAQQILAPIISRQTINNTEQTMVAVAPNPHSNASSLIKWQLKRSSYTDSYS